MASVYAYSIASVLLVSLVSFVGVFALALKEQMLRKYVSVLVSLAVGALIGDAVIHLIPEAFEEIGNSTHVSLAIIIGIFVFFSLEKFLHWHHHELSESEEKIHPTGRLILVSDGVHNFIDGLIIGVSYLAGVEIGIATTIAVILHEIPQEIGDFGVLLHAGYRKVKALWLNFASALTAVLGTVVALVIGESAEAAALWLLPVAAGGFLYIAMADLIPELHKTRVSGLLILELGAVAVGIFSMFLLLGLE